MPAVLVLELEYEPFDPGIVSVWPTLIEDPEILLALFSELILTPCFSATPPKVSPDLTLYLLELLVPAVLVLELEVPFAI